MPQNNPSYKSIKLPIGSRIQLFQENTIPIPNIPQIHKASVNISDISNLLIPVKLVIVLVILGVN